MACGSGSSDVSTKSEQVATTERTATSVEATNMPEDWEIRVTDGAERDETLRLLDEAIVSLGPERADLSDHGDGFDVRVVEPTPQDEKVVALLQAETTIPLKVVAVPMSASWLQRTSEGLAGDMSNSAATVGVDMEAGKLYILIDRQKTPELGGDAFTDQVKKLVEPYLSEGRLAGAVAEGVTAEQAFDIVEGHVGFER